MRTILSIAALLGVFASVAKAQEPAAPEVRVTGILYLDSRASALMEIRPTRGGLIRPILRTGEQINGVQVVSIDPQQGLVTVKIGDAHSTIPVDGTPASAVAPTLNLRSAEEQQVLEAYQEITGRTVLRAGNLPGAKIELQLTGALSRVEGSYALEKALEEKGIALKPVGEKFACAVRVGDEASIDALPPLPPAAPAPIAGQPKPTVANEVLPAGMIKFLNADILQAIEIYQELAARTVLRGPQLAGKVTIRSQTSLSRVEAIWLMEAAVQLSGTRLVPDGERFATAVPIKRASPAVRPNSLVRPEDDRTLPAGMLKFDAADLTQVLAVYAQLCRRQMVPADQIPAVRLSIRTQTALTTTEALHALDVVAACHGLEFVPVDEDRISVRPRPAGADTAPVPK